MKLAVIGHFGQGRELLNGQTVKTKDLVYGLEQYAQAEVTLVDTHGWSRRPLALIRNVKASFAQCEGVIMLPAHKGVQVFAPLLAHFKKKYSKKIYYDVIGGWLPELLRGKKKLARTLRCFDGIWVETASMKEKLEEQGFSNVTVIPNFKRIRPLQEQELVYSEDEPLRLCTFSRVMPEKGIGLAVEAVRQANARLGRQAFSLDLYGQIDENSGQWFEALQQTFPEGVTYRGCVDASESVGVLKNYFALLFPTCYQGEGFAGTLIDACCAGLPVIASDWRYNRELVTDRTGVLFPARDGEALTQILMAAAQSPGKLSEKKRGCLAEARKYRIDMVISLIIQNIEGTEGHGHFPLQN